MRPVLTCALLASTVAMPALANASPDPTQWFFNATALYRSTVTATQTHKPDYIGGTTQSAMHCGAAGKNIAGVWELLKYDRRHNIALAVASTDQCSAALFKALPLGVSVPDADLSGYQTGRGVRLGMSYRDVLAIYGGTPTKSGKHFVVAYAADVTGTTVSLPHRTVKLPQTITLVFDDGRLSSIAVIIEEGALF